MHVLVLYFWFLQELWKNCLKQQEIKRKSKIKLLARSKLNSIESKISEALITKLVTKTLWQLLTRKKISRIKKSIRIMNGQRSDVEKINLIEEGKKNGINIKCKFKIKI